MATAHLYARAAQAPAPTGDRGRRAPRLRPSSVHQRQAAARAARSRRPARSMRCSWGNSWSSTLVKRSRRSYNRRPMSGPFDRRRSEDLAHTSDPRRGDIERVTQKPEHARWSEHPRDLGECGILVKPMERGAYRDGIHARVRQRQLLREPPSARAAGSWELRMARISSSGSTAVTRWPAASSALRQLAGSGAEVEHLQRLITEQPFDRLGRISGAATLVLGCDTSERARALSPARARCVGLADGAHTPRQGGPGHQSRTDQ